MSVASNLENAKAKEKIIESAKNLYSAELTLPLGNPNLKLVHTNQFLFTQTNIDGFELANFEDIARALNSTDSRYSGYVLNRWYINATTITNNGKDAHIKLGLSPFASSVSSYRDAKQSFTSAYSDAIQAEENASKSNSSKTSVKSVSSKNSTLAGGEGKFIDDLVKKIVGKETNILKKAKLIHTHLINHLRYSYYECSHHSTPKACYEARNINCADTARLTASMFRSANIPCYVVHSTCHFYTVFEYNGKLHCSDATSSSTRATIDKYWKGSSCHSGTTVKFTGKGCYSSKCGKNPTC